MNYIKGNLFDSKADVLCHQVNLYGVMGGGIASELRERYPNVYNRYRNHCDEYKFSESLLGSSLIVPKDEKNNQYIANCFCQNDFSRDGCLTNYEKMRECFINVINWMKQNGKKTVAFPYKIGCGIAGGNWSIVLGIIEDVFKDVEVEIWELK